MLFSWFFTFVITAFTDSKQPGTQRLDPLREVIIAPYE
jgi:hypothetical protein